MKLPAWRGLSLSLIALTLPGLIAGLSPAASAQAEQPAASKTVAITIDALSNRHDISPYVYGVAYPNSSADGTHTGRTEVRSGGNATSRYNWMAWICNAANGGYFGGYGLS